MKRFNPSEPTLSPSQKPTVAKKFIIPYQQLMPLDPNNMKQTKKPKQTSQMSKEREEFLLSLLESGSKYDVQQSTQQMFLENTSQYPITALAQDQYIIGKIKNFRKGMEVINEYKLDSQCCQLLVNDLKIIVVGPFIDIFEKDLQVGIFIPKSYNQNAISSQKIIIIQKCMPNKCTNLLDHPYIVIDPYNLLYPTYICSWVQCRRRISLQHYVQGTQLVNVVLVVGTACHRYMQALIKKQITSELNETQFRKIYQQFLYDMYLINYSYSDFILYCQNSLKNINQLYRRYLSNLEQNQLIQIQNSRNCKKYLKITKIIAPEVMMRSDYFGLKGKVDLLLSGEIIENPKTPKQTKTQVFIPFELKTGKNQSHTHKQQVDIYLLLVSEKYRKPVIGILYYSQTNKIIVRNSNPQDSFVCVVALRNEIVFNLINLQKQPSKIILPSYASNLSNCFKKKWKEGQIYTCQYLFQCNAVSKCKAFKQDMSQSHKPPMDKISEVKDIMNQYPDEALEYFNKWFLMIHQEQFQNKSNSRLLQKSGFNSFLLQCEQLSKLLDEKNPRKQLEIYKNIKSQISFDKIQYLYRQTQKVRVIINKINLIEGCKIVSSKRNKKKYTLTIEFNNQDIQFNKIHAKWFMMTGQEILQVQIEKFQNNVFSSMRTVLTNFIKNAQPWLRDVVIRKRDYDDICFSQEIEFTQSQVQQKQDKIREQLIEDLNEDQRLALLKATTMEKFLLIEGMPGTGKTQLIITMIEYFYKMGKTVLITTFTNRAIDNIIERLLRKNVIPQNKIIREGSKYSMSDRVRPLSHRSQTFNTIGQYQEYFNQKKIWFVTISSLYIHHIPSMFDVVMLDQASQCLQPMCLQALQKANKFILIGDYKQLEPVVKSKAAKQKSMGTSLFQRLCHQYPNQTVSLTIQYRMCRQIMELSNQLVYQNKLQLPSNKIGSQRMHLTQNWKDHIPTILQKFFNPKNPIVFINLDPLMKQLQSTKQNDQGSEISKQITNLKKIRKILQVQICTYLYKKFLKFHEMQNKKKQQYRQQTAIITAYNSSVSSIVASLVKSGVFQENSGDVLTIDKSQGIDKKTILFLIQRNSEEDLLRSQLFDNPKRLNVALTRAKSKLIIIGSQQLLLRLKCNKGALGKLLQKYQYNLTYEQIKAIVKDEQSQYNYRAVNE